MKPTWYVKHPTFQYCEDVKSIAKERGLRIIDAKFQDGAPQCDNAPQLTLCNKPVPVVDDIDTLKAEADKLGVEYGPRIGYETLLERVEQARG